MTGRPLSEERRLTLGLLMRTMAVISATFLVSMLVAAWMVQHRQREEAIRTIEARSRAIGRAIASIMEDPAHEKAERAQVFVEGTGKDPLIKNLMVIANDGVVAFAKDPADVARKIDPASMPVCASCHGQPTVNRRGRSYVTESGTRVLHFVYPIESREKCRECHEKDNGRRATLLAEMSLDEADASILQAGRSMFLAVFMLGLFFTIVAYLLLRTVTYKPLEAIAGRLRLIAAGDFSAHDVSGHRGIMGFIHHQINRTARVLKDHYDGLERTVAERTQSLRRSQQALAKERDKLRFVFDNSPQGYVSVNSAGVIVFANQRAADILGGKGDLVGRNVGEYDVLRQVVDHRILDVYVDPVGARRTRVMIDNTRSLEVHAYPIALQDGEPIVLVMLNDVTDKQRVEQHLERHERLASVGRLAAGVAHEVGNPLSAISSLVQITHKIEDREAVRLNCELIQNHIGRITNIVRGLAATARGADDDSVVADVGDVVRSVVEIASWDKRAGRVRFNLHENGDKDAFALPRDRLAQALLNILLNGLDAMQDTEEPVLDIAVERSVDVCCIAISDNGLGIPDGELGRIFEPFYTTKPPGTGTGLGLAVTHESIRKMGGRIDVESRVGRGSTFTITLPRSEASWEQSHSAC